MDLLIKICDKYNLGKMVSEPVILSGGFLHKMYGISTSKGKYAVKLLNPHIMEREGAKENYRIAEELEFRLEQHNIPILPAIVFNDQKMQEMEGQFFYIFEWHVGKALHGEEISKEHCIKIGQELARIHQIDIKKEPYRRNEIHIDWNDYLDKIKEKNQEIYILLKNHLSLLYESQEKGNAAIKENPPIVTICHNDMDCKNVLWKGMEYRIIDLECLTYTSPFIEMYELALCWSGYSECNINFELFKAFIEAYFAEGGLKPDNWECLYYGNYGRLEWLEYNLKRVLGIECDKSEEEMGISEVIATMGQVVYYDQMKEKILENLRSIKNNIC